MVQNNINDLINEVQKDLEDLVYGSVELFVQDGQVTQVTIRRIKKTGFNPQNTSSTQNYSKNIKSKINVKVGLDNT